MIRDLYQKLTEEDKKDSPKKKTDRPEKEEPVLIIKLVDGKKIRDGVCVDFIGGGHNLAYPDIIPKGEIWIEQDLSPEEQTDILVHELVEFALMSKADMTYTPAHTFANKMEKVFRGFEGRWKIRGAPEAGEAIVKGKEKAEVEEKEKKVAESLINETYTNGLIYFLKYLEAGIDVYDFAHELEAFFESKGMDHPETYDPDEPFEFLESKEFESLKPKFQKYLEENIRADDAALPTYLYLDSAKLVPRNTWLVHFSDDADDIATSGFTYGAEDYTKIGLTTHFSDKVRKKGPGWNFAFKLDSRYSTRAADSGKYGKHAVLFQCAGVEAHHSGDSEDQVVFWGPAAHNRYLLMKDGEGNWCVRHARTHRVLFQSEEFDDVAVWVTKNEHQYRKVITNDLPQKPIFPTPVKDRARMQAKPSVPMPKSIQEAKKWDTKGGRFITPEEKNDKKKKRPSYKIYKGIPTNPPQAIQVAQGISESEENQSLLVIVNKYASNKHPDDHVPEDYDWARDKAFNVSSLEHMMPGGIAGWKSWLADEVKGVPGQWDKLATTKKIDDPVIISPGHIWDGWHRIAAAIVNGHATIPAIVGRLHAR